jgi:hypothetical protein
VVGTKTVVNPTILVQEEAGQILATPLHNVPVQILRPTMYERTIPGEFKVTVYEPRRHQAKVSRTAQIPVVDLSEYLVEVK